MAYHRSFSMSEKGYGESLTQYLDERKESRDQNFFSTCLYQTFMLSSEPEIWVLLIKVPAKV